MALQITDANFEELVNSGKPMVLDFWAEWCGPCKMMTTKIFPMKEAGEFFNPRFVCVKFDMEQGEGKELKNQFGIRNIPTVLFFKDGKVVDKQVGAAPKTTFVSKIEALL